MWKKDSHGLVFWKGLKTTDPVSLIISAEKQGIMNTHWASDTTLGLSVTLSYSILATCELDPSWAGLQEGGFAAAADPILEVTLQTPSAWHASTRLSVVPGTLPASHTPSHKR